MIQNKSLYEDCLAANVISQPKYVEKGERIIILKNLSKRAFQRLNVSFIPASRAIVFRGRLIFRDETISLAYEL